MIYYNDNFVVGTGFPGLRDRSGLLPRYYSNGVRGPPSAPLQSLAGCVIKTRFAGYFRYGIAALQLPQALKFTGRVSVQL